MKNLPKIFIVEDDAFFASILKNEILKKSIGDIQTFSNGEDCLDNLYKKADIYSDESGGVPKFYMYAESIWYYLDKYTKADFDQRTMEVLKKFSSSHEEKEFGAISLPAHRKTQYDFDYDWKNNKNIIRLDDFIRTGTQSSLTQYLPAVPTEKLGVGYFSLTHKNEVLRFKLHTQQAIFAVGKF